MTARRAAAALVVAVADAVRALKRALLDGQDAAAIERAITAVKGPYSRLFLKFG